MVKKIQKLENKDMVVQINDNAKTPTNPHQAKKMDIPFYKDPHLAKTGLDAALTKLKEYPQTDTANIAAIGYCYGGFIVLNAAKLGEDLKGVVSFHGDLSGVAPDKKLLRSKILVCHGADDKFVNQQAVDR